MADRDYICAYCLVDAHEKCTRGQGCKCECRTGKPLVVRSPAAHAEQAAKVIADGRLSPNAVRAAVAEMTAEGWPCADPACGHVPFPSEQGARTHFARMHGPNARRWSNRKKKPAAAIKPSAPRSSTVQPDPVAPPAVEPAAPAAEMISQRARDVADTIAFLDHTEPADVLAHAIDLWAEQALNDREDVSTIVRVVTKRRMAANQ